MVWIDRSVGSHSHKDSFDFGEHEFDKLCTCLFVLHFSSCFVSSDTERSGRRMQCMPHTVDREYRDAPLKMASIKHVSDRGAGTNDAHEMNEVIVTRTRLTSESMNSTSYALACLSSISRVATAPRKVWQAYALHASHG